MISSIVTLCVPCSSFDTILDILDINTGSATALKTPTTAPLNNDNDDDHNNNNDKLQIKRLHVVMWGRKK